MDMDRGGCPALPSGLQTVTTGDRPEDRRVQASLGYMRPSLKRHNDSSAVRLNKSMAFQASALGSCVVLENSLTHFLQALGKEREIKVPKAITP